MIVRNETTLPSRQQPAGGPRNIISGQTLI
jgi:hypothetical protein